MLEKIYPCPMLPVPNVGLGRMKITASQLGEFNQNGFVFVPDVLDMATVISLRDRFERLFSGDFETGIVPDEVNWQMGLSDPALTRQICNGWKADRTIAATVQNAGIAQALDTLAGWGGVRLMQDNLLWKPPGAKSLGFHRDSAYATWYTPAEMITCWIALDDTTQESGTMELAVGSHLWPKDHDPETTFHAPDDYRQPVNQLAAQASVVLDITYVELKAGSVSFHHGWTWHGSGPNQTAQHRRALAIHCAPPDVRIDGDRLHEGNGPLYKQYWNGTTGELPEEHFPLLVRS